MVSHAVAGLAGWRRCVPGRGGLQAGFRDRWLRLSWRRQGRCGRGLVRGRRRARQRGSRRRRISAPRERGYQRDRACDSLVGACPGHQSTIGHETGQISNPEDRQRAASVVDLTDPPTCPGGCSECPGRSSTGPAVRPLTGRGQRSDPLLIAKANVSSTRFEGHPDAGPCHRVRRRGSSRRRSTNDESRHDRDQPKRQRRHRWQRWIRESDDSQDSDPTREHEPDELPPVTLALSAGRRRWGHVVRIGKRDDRKDQEADQDEQVAPSRARV